MNSKEISKGILKALATVLGVSLLLLFLYKIQSVIVYIAISAVVSLTGRPIVGFLRYRLKLNNLLAVAITMVLILAVIIGLIGLFIPLIVKQGQNLSLLNIEALQGNIKHIYTEFISPFNLRKIFVNENPFANSNLLPKIVFNEIPKFL